MASSKMLDALIAKLRQALSGQFLAGVMKLAGAAALAQAILMGALVIATRLYSPADFGVLAVFNAVVTIVAVAACLRFDIAVPLPREQKDAVNLLGLAFLSAGAVACGFSLLVALAPERHALLLFDPSVYKHLWLAGPAIFFLAGMSALQNWFIRQKAYGTVARNRIVQALVHATIQLGGGWIFALPVFLVLGQMANFATAVVVLGGVFLLQSASLLREVTVARMRSVASEYRQFPIYSTWEAFFNAAGIFVPVILIGALAPPAEVGHLQLGLYAMQAMIGLVGAAIAQVYFSRAAEEHNAGRLAGFTGTVLVNLAKTGPGPLLAIGITAPFVFPVVFGEEWTRSGILVAWMTPWFVLQFLASPISLALAVTRRQRAAFLLQLFGFFFRSGAVLFAAYALNGYVTEAYALSGVVFYAAYLAVIMAASRISISSVVADIRRIGLIWAFWILLAGVVSALATMWK
ncbi:hypothetical protein [uncultured Hoeflea sp.]|uniref:lipopolysaccharide biosynthesis protein n=1 Tax=uncultured Hoeflea sp. TaxID=538666 RepID=UPI002610B187|nr:hypothetical protein [uncultured Hoeflea sp.]